MEKTLYLFGGDHRMKTQKPWSRQRLTQMLYLLWLFLYPLNLGLLGIFATGAIVGTIQLIPTELYFRKRLTWHTKT